MLEFDAAKNRLYAFKSKVACPPVPKREASVEWRSLQRYLERGLKEDITNEFMPRLKEALKAEDYDIVFDDFKVATLDDNYHDDRTLKVKVRFNSAFIDKNSPDNRYVTIISLPSMTEDGRILYEKKYYGFIKLLEQEPSVSYDEKSLTEKVLKIKVPKGFLSIVWKASGLKLELSDLRSKNSLLNYDLIATMFAMGLMEGYNPEQLRDEFHCFDVRSKMCTEESFNTYATLTFANTGSVNQIDYLNQVVPRLMGTPITDVSRKDGIDSSIYRINENYKSIEVREAINEILSLDRAIGETLGKDVYSRTNPDILLYQAGTIITGPMLDECRRHGVYNIFIDKKIAMEGYYLAQYIFINYVPKGTKMIPELVDYLPEETGMYVSKDYHFSSEDPIIFDDSTPLTRELIDLFSKCGYDSVTISQKPNRAFKGKDKERFPLFFTEEVLSNRMFKAEDVGVASVSNWVYLNANNEWEDCPDFWTTYDIAALISLVSKLFQGQYTHIVTNADIGFRKRLIMPEEMYHRAFRHACIEGFKKFTSAKSLWNSNKWDFFTKDVTDNFFYPFQKSFFEYLRDKARCLQLLTSDSITNPISYISALNKINVFVPNKHSVADGQRRIAIGSYGRVDAFEIPQSHKLGVVMTQCIGNQVDLDGNMRVGYRELIHNGTTTTVSDKITYLTVAEEEKWKIADIGSIDFDVNGVCHDNTQMCLCRCPSTISIDKSSFSYTKISQCKYVNAHATQLLSWAAATVAHLDSNDANRATFGIAQAKQAKGLVNPQAPRVGTTANLYIPRLNDYFCVIARKSGTVDAIHRPNLTKDIDSALKKKSTAPKEYELILQLNYDDGTKEDIHMEEITNSGYSVCVRDVIVEVGQHFEEGDVLVTSNFMDGDCMALGQNKLVGYVPTGKNYEDGTNATQKACEELLSYKLKEVFCPNKHDKSNQMVFTNIKYGKYLDMEYDGSICTVTNGKAGAVNTSQVHVKPDKGHGFLEKCNVRIGKSSHGKRLYEGIDAAFLSVDAFTNGDKCSNRHGNKGVMPSPEKNSTMLRLPNGMVLDIAYNPHGVTSRMNIGQVRECNLGLAMEVLDVYCITDAFNSITGDEIKMLLKYAHDLANSKTDSEVNSIISSNPDIPLGLHEHARNNIKKIRLWAGTFDERGESYLIDPSTGKMTETKALIGINYVLKMIQESDSKVHARAGMMSGEPYSVIAGCPTKGASNHGGQSFGNMEMDGLCAYGAAELIHELTNERGDNAVARSNMMVEQYLPDELKAEYYIESDGQRRSTTQLLYTMLALGCICEADDDEFIPLAADNCELGSWTKSALIEASKDFSKAKENKTYKRDKKRVDEDDKKYEQQMEEHMIAMNMLRGIKNN